MAERLTFVPAGGRQSGPIPTQNGIIFPGIVGKGLLNVSKPQVQGSRSCSRPSQGQWACRRSDQRSR